MVLEKVREIAILRSMGYRRGDISAIFLWQGLLVAVIGSVAGCVLGALLTWGVSRIPIKMRGFFATEHFLVYWSWYHYAAATGIAFVGVFLASYFPARRAAKLAPVAILRGSGQ
jgi:lipoprotein-releasing system permease protein